MACRTISIPGRGIAIVCGPSRRRTPRRCIVCHCPDWLATMKLCDYALGPGPSQTCDRPVCVEHAYHVEPDTDYCPAHAGSPTREELPA
jgi:hypothetical protein